MKKINATMLLGFGVALAAAAAAPATIEFTRPDGTKMTATALTDNVIRVAPAGRGLESRIAVTPKGDFTGTASANSIVTSTGVKVSVDPSTGALSISGGGRRGITDSGRRGKDASGRHTLALGCPAVRRMCMAVVNAVTASTSRGIRSRCTTRRTTAMWRVTDASAG